MRKIDEHHHNIQVSLVLGHMFRDNEGIAYQHNMS